MTSAGPLLEVRDVSKNYNGVRPLRIVELIVAPRDRVVLAGFDAPSAETFVHLVTGAAVPDSGIVRLDGHDTREISTDTAWLASLDRIGIVTARAVLLESMSTAANLALPLTIAIDPIPPGIRTEVDALAQEIGLASDRLTSPASRLSAEERVRLHLARAIALGPQLVLLEHPTAGLEASSGVAIGATLERISRHRQIAWVALSDDDGFARASGATRLRLDAATGKLKRKWF
jgi:ABC-type lipoprotein export system ATPase subunit